MYIIYCFWAVHFPRAGWSPDSHLTFILFIISHPSPSNWHTSTHLAVARHLLGSCQAQPLLFTYVNRTHVQLCNLILEISYLVSQLSPLSEVVDGKVSLVDGVTLLLLVSTTSDFNNPYLIITLSSCRVNLKWV